MRFLIYGAGALGQALGCMLTVSGHQVDLVLRKRFLKIIAEEGLNVTGIYGNFHASAQKLNLMTDVAGADGSVYDFILITTKAYDTAHAAKNIAALSKCTSPVVSMQNGCGNIEQLSAQFGNERTLGARIITGFEIEQAARVKITVSADAVHIGSSLSGRISEKAQKLADAISQAGLPCSAVEDIFQSLHAKLLYNCALNPLGAILGVHYGALSDNKATRTIMNRVIDETFNVIKALGNNIPWPTADRYKELFYNTLIPATFRHRPSMLQDLENNKLTEVDALLGYVSVQGQKAGVATPTCELLASLIRFKEDAALRTKPRQD
ncbi:MAG: ketopantoate reductase family protein [Deltaproteobacteria bacterium]|nr:ketopantoate reductase family protein [Deltaproteobacteria bacterium]